jgi:hypothetical protein
MTAIATDAALARLERALDAIERAVEARIEEDARRADLELELHRLGGDRSRLAQSLDSAVARAARLEEANREVSRRLVGAMETIRGVLARQQGQ